MIALTLTASYNLSSEELVMTAPMPIDLHSYASGATVLPVLRAVLQYHYLTLIENLEMWS
jgi:hypothetical protein